MNIAVGESEGNVRAEKAIRGVPDKGRVQDKVWTRKCQVEIKTGIGIDKFENLMSWLVRWDGELTSR